MSNKPFTLHDLIKYLRPDIFNITIDGIRIYDINGIDEACNKVIILEGVQ